MRTLRRAQSGVMLLEALIGMLIFTIGILALVGMQGFAMRTAAESKYRADASFMANQVIGSMWVDITNILEYDTAKGRKCPGGTPSLPAEKAACRRDNWAKQVEVALPGVRGGNEPTIAVNGDEVTVTVQWQRKADGSTTGDFNKHNYVAVAKINGQ